MPQSDEARRHRGHQLELIALASAVSRRMAPVLEHAQRTGDQPLQEKLHRLRDAANEAERLLRERLD